VTRLPLRVNLIFVAMFGVLVVVPLLALYFVAYTQSPAEAPDPLKPKATRDRPLVIVSPLLEQKLKGAEVPVRFDLKVDDYKLAQAADVPTNKAKELTHLHVILDDGQYDTPEHSSSPLFEQEDSSGKYSALVEPQVTYRDIPPGPHTLRVELVYNDHDPKSGIAGDKIEFEVIP
jgi:hypothetical protein